MTKEYFEKSINDLFEEIGCDIRFYCHDENHIRIGFNGNYSNQFVPLNIKFKFLTKVTDLVKTKDIEVNHISDWEGSDSYELIINGFTVDE